MLIKRIKLHNIRSYEDEDIEFRSGTLLFEGDIGSGKTSILMAMEFALFGTTEGGFYEKILRKGKNEGFVEITFEHGGEEYTIYRSIKKIRGKVRSDESYIITPNGKKIVSPTEIKSYVLGLIGVKISSKKRKSLPIITYAIYTPQETMKNILEGKNEERFEVIRKIFNLDDYKIARDNVEMIYDKIGSEIEIGLRRKEDVERIDDEMEKIREDIENLTRDMEKMQEEMKRENKKLQSIEKKMNEEKEKRRNYENLKKEREKMIALLKKYQEDVERDGKEMNLLEKKILRMREIEEYTKRYEEIKKKIEDMKGDMDRLHEMEKKLREDIAVVEEIERRYEKSGEWKERIRDIEGKIKYLKESLKEKSDVERLQEENNKKMQVLMGTMEHNRKKLEDLEEEKKEYENLGATCPVCKRPLTEEHKKKLRGEVEEKIEKVRKNMENIKLKIAKVEEQQKELKARMEEMNKFEIELAKISREHSLLKSRIDELESERNKSENIKLRIEKEKKEIEKLSIQKKEYQSLEEERKELEPVWKEYLRLSSSFEDMEKLKMRISENEGRINEIKGKLNEIDDEIKRINFSEEEYEKVEEEYTRLREKLSEISRAVKDAEEYLAKRREELRKDEKRRKEFIEEINRAEKLKEFHTWLNESFVSALENIERNMLLNINENFRILFEKWFNELLGESDYDATIDENFRPVVRYEKYDMPISTLSGGERTSIALAYRLALNSMVKKALGLKTNLLILDEPTDGFSKDQLYKLKDILDKMDTDQIIIVSHEKELENIADSIYLVKKRNSASTIGVI